MKAKAKMPPMKKKLAPIDPNAWQAAPEARELLTPELIRLLNNIPEPHAAKKRTTVRRLAFALANNEDVKTVFNRTDTCAETIWYGKWKHDPDIAKAFEAYKARVLEWRDEETARLESHYRRARLQKIAQYAADAPDTIKDVMISTIEKGQTRLEASLIMLKLADPEKAEGAQLRPGSTIENTLNLNDLSDEAIIELIKRATNDGAGSGGTAAPADGTPAST